VYNVIFSLGNCSWYKNWCWRACTKSYETWRKPRPKVALILMALKLQALLQSIV